jgi:hypothetical protein
MRFHGEFIAGESPLPPLAAPTHAPFTDLHVSTDLHVESSGVSDYQAARLF